MAAGSVEVALLLTSELVSNAVLHARTPVTVHYVVDGDVYVAVTDDDPRHPRVQEPRTTDTGGRGVLLVDALADSWGVEPTADGKTVFFRVRLDLR